MQLEKKSHKQFHRGVIGIESAIEQFEVWLKDWKAEGPDIELIPLRTDACGNFDCLVAQHETIAGAVVFWDHAELREVRCFLGGSLDAYLSFWCRHLTNCYSPDGRMYSLFKPRKLDHFPWLAPGPKTDPWPFDLTWLCGNDARVDELLSHPDIEKWIADW